MDITAVTFLEILKTALMRQKIGPEREISADEWDKLLRLASIHNVLPLVFETVRLNPSFSGTPFPAAVKRQVMQQVIAQTVRSNEFLELNQRLQAAGVRPLIVKGIVCRNLYPQPDHRPSSDEDVLIPPEMFNLCHPVLAEFGMGTESDHDAYEVPYRKTDGMLYIELHKHLFPPDSDAYGDLNRFFDGVHDRAIPEEIQGRTVYTLGYTDHLFYLICHAFKHFLHSGFGIRQVCDIVLYANRYGQQVDWTRVLENCRAIRAEQFAAALFQIGSRYLTFDPDIAAYPDAWRNIQVDELPLLNDLLSAGLYGSADMSRKHSSSITLDAVSSEKQGRKSKNAVLLSAFPPASKLEGRYPYLKKHPYLLPVAWSSRLWDYAKETRNSRDNTATDALKIGNERTALLKIYGILK